MGDHWKRSVRSALVGLALSAVWAGCAGVPTSGPVVYHTPPPARVPSDILVAPLPPADDAEPSLIVDGFLHAMSVYQPDYEIARQYLTMAASAEWRPEAGVQIYADGSPPTVVEDDVVLSAPLVGTLNERGEYTSAPGQRVRQDFDIVRDNSGQWRISNPPQGLLISRYLFSSGYAGVDLHHLNASGTMLIPEPIWVPAGSEQYRRVLRAQLSGPSEWIAPLAMDVPTLQLDDAVVAAGTMGVRVSGAAGLSPEQRRAALLGLVATATQLGGVSQVEVTSGGAAWTLPEHAGTRFSARDVAAVEPAPADPAGGLVVAKDGSVQTASVQDPSTKLAAVAPDVHDPDTVAAHTKQGVVAAVVDQGKSLVTSPTSGGVTQLRAGAHLLRPQFSGTGELWSAEASGIASLQAVKGLDSLKTSVPNPPSGKLIAFGLSPDGSRLAAAVEGKTGVEVGLMLIQREEQSVTVGGWRPLVLSSVDATSVLDLGWSAATELLLLVADARGATSVVRTSQDGAVSADIGPSVAAGFVELATAPQHQALLRSSGGMVYRFDADFSWTLWLTGVTAVAFAR